MKIYGFSLSYDSFGHDNVNRRDIRVVTGGDGMRVRILASGWIDRQEAYEKLKALGKNPTVVEVHGYSYLEYDVKQGG